MSKTTLGIDLASSEQKTAACLVRWSEPVEIAIARANFMDADLEELMQPADKVGIDVPLGWPRKFAESVGSYMSGVAWQADHRSPDLRLRATDRHVATTRGRHPLSVSTDRIAIPAMRAAKLLSQIDSGFDRAGAGKVVEVYPAASLKAWGFDPDRYKGAKGRTIRERLVAKFIADTAGWVRIADPVREECIRDDNVFDALICALTARAAQLGLCDPIPDEHVESARFEGWIALPSPASLAKLAAAVWE